MKTISLHVSDPTYRIFQEESERRDRPAAELIREAMEEYVRMHFANRRSLADIRPVSLGKPLASINWSEDIFDEMVS
ncbi:MAG: ribbon-helix-helix protein, CopG family [Verrucomicrobiae bacterium]